ncbi:hypothetical protein BD324DRAFT_514435 [Kockovaella imperatae]|uniref:Protein SQS1 n=1 Tax=Kockovaella imperatae TaxID=4999 RepID=A0A1Y1UFY0_9TREE|nr:hypothetical protein BD324DRAFT_514435 [Kockovaella imperatae]ORX35975.1 hypothetical protein BD324DRAFT_514435 [Kockovaella imperatae]
MLRQSFDDFLDFGGPSRSRGRGRGRGRGGGGAGPGSFRGRGQTVGNRGGRGGLGLAPPGAGTGGRSFKSDYSDVHFDYTTINKQGYTKLDAYTVAPFGNTSTDPSHTPRNRYKGKNKAFDSNLNDDKNTPSGSTTPVTGLGYHGRGHTFPSSRGFAPDRAGIGGGGRREKHRSGDTVGKIGVSWGGGSAPIFVKAGELFKDGEVDVVTVEQDLQIDVMPMSDPSATQLTVLQDEIEFEVTQGRRTFGRIQAKTPIQSDRSTPEQAHSEPPVPDIQFVRAAPSVDVPAVPVDPPLSKLADSQVNRHLFSVNSGDSATEVVDFASFFIDTEPSAISEKPLYQPTPLPALRRKPTEPAEEENIVFVPKSHSKPEPVLVEESVFPSQAAAAGQHVSRALVNPHALSRREKKAQKKDKRGRVKGKGKKKNKQVTIQEGSDIDWGSDGPPVDVVSVDGDVEGKGEEDMELLRDYLAGTLLNAQDSSEEEDGYSGQEAEEPGDAGDGAADTGDGDIEDLSSGEEDNPSLEDGNSWAVGFETESESSDSSSELAGPSRVPQNNPYDEGSEDEDEDDIDAMFNGRDSWNEADWFIQNMEAALDGRTLAKGKAARSIFNSVENGDFGDEWDLNPVRKGKKNQRSLIPPELQGQWESDRQRKAEKKRQRELERLVAQIEPTALRKGKGKLKGNTKAERANLSRLSASEVADMFDHPVRDGSDPVGRMMSSLLSGGSLEVVNQGILRLLSSPGRSTYSTAPMSKEGRIKVHMLAECYGLKSKSKGKGHERFTILVKTDRSGFYKALYSKYSGGAKKRGPGDRGTSARMRDGETVGEGADRIGMENVGHKLLSRMGWAEGDRIGRTEGGLDNPIMAIVKNTKSGLGA